MLPDRVSNPGPLTYESGALLIALRGPPGCSYPNLISSEACPNDIRLCKFGENPSPGSKDVLLPRLWP